MDDREWTEAAELQQHLQQASQLSEDGRWDEAFRVLLDQEQQHPEDATLLCMLGVAAGEVDAAGMAYDYFRRCLAQQPTDPFILVPLGTGLARYDDPEAEGVLRLAALSAPDLAAARLQYGAYLAREGQLELAISELQAARSLDAEEPRIGRELGVAYLLHGSLDDALAEMERAIALDEGSGDLHLIFGLALVQAGRAHEAAEELHRAAREELQDGEVQLASALACAAEEWWDEAWESLARADAAEFSADPLVQREVEEALESGATAAESLLREELAPSLLRERLLEPF